MADRRLQVFHTVARMLSFTKAAEALDMTQPAVTFQVRQLEEQHGVRLFDRSHNRIGLTEAGERVFQYAERIFNLYGEMEHAIREVTGNVAGTLKIGVSNLCGSYRLPKILSDFQQQYPEVHVQLKMIPTQSVLTMVENSFVDVGVTESRLDMGKFKVQQIGDEELVLVKPANLFRSSDTLNAIHDWISYPWIFPEESDFAGRQLFAQLLKSQGKDIKQIKIVMELGCIEAIKGAVQVGRGVSILPRKAVQNEVNQGLLVAEPFPEPLMRSISLIFKEQKYPLPMIDELVMYAKEGFADSSTSVSHKAIVSPHTEEGQSSAAI